MKKFFKNFYLLLIFLFLYAPIVVLMIFSFNDSKSRRLWNGFTTRWYVELFRDADILHSLYVTLLVAVAAAAIATVLGTIAAIGIHNMGRRAKAAYLTVNNIPMSSSDTIMGVTFMLLFAAIGLDKGYLTLILAHVTFCTPYVVLNVMPKLRQLDKNAYEAALDLGATPHQALHKVILPEIMPGIVTGAIMAFTMSIDDFVVSYFTAGTTSQPLSVVIYSMTRHRMTPEINAISTILFLIVLALLIVINVRQSLGRREAPRSRAPERSDAAVKKRMLSLLLCGAMCAGLLPAAAMRPRQRCSTCTTGVSTSTPTSSTGSRRKPASRLSTTPSIPTKTCIRASRPRAMTSLSRPTTRFRALSTRICSSRSTTIIFRI